MPPPAEPPTLGEVLRRLDQVSVQVSEQFASLAREIKEDRAAASSTYVRQDVFMSERRVLESNIKDIHSDVTTIKEDRKSDIGWRRQFSLWLAGLAVMSILSLVGLVIQLVK